MRGDRSSSGADERVRHPWVVVSLGLQADLHEGDRLIRGVDELLGQAENWEFRGLLNFRRINCSSATRKSGLESALSMAVLRLSSELTWTFGVFYICGATDDYRK